MTAVPVRYEPRRRPAGRLRRAAESAAEAGVVLALAALPSAWHSLNPARAVVLAGVFAVLTGATYALHTVTFDCLRLTAGRTNRRTTGRQNRKFFRIEPEE